MGTLLARMVRSRWIPFLSLALVASLPLLPREGLGIPLCSFKLMTGVPCPGCGLTRSLIQLAHGDVGSAAVLHPVGLVLFPLLLGTALLVFVARPRRERLARWLERHQWGANAAAVALGCLFVGNAVFRTVWILWWRQPSVW